VARISFQKQPGHWSAFWMMCNGFGKVGDDGRDGTEIDIMEKPWLDARVQHTFHWDGYGILPNAAVRVLDFPDFTARDGAIQQPEEGKEPHIQFRSGPHTFIARAIDGNYPNYRQVIPHEFLADNYSCVRGKRSSLGIPAHEKISWTSELLARLGKEPDNVIAHELGVSGASVGEKRRGLGMPGHNKISWTPELIARLGKEPDSGIARSMGVSATSVTTKRFELGIPTYNKVRLVPRETWTPALVALVGRREAELQPPFANPNPPLQLPR